MSRRLERRNINLYNEEILDENKDNHSDFKTKNHQSPNRQVFSYKTENKRSISRIRFDAEGVDESLVNQQDDEFHQFEAQQVLRDTNVEKPFGLINRNIEDKNKRGNNAILPK